MCLMKCSPCLITLYDILFLPAVYQGPSPYLLYSILLLSTKVQLVFNVQQTPKALNDLTVILMSLNTGYYLPHKFAL